MEANAGESFQMQILSNIFPRISLHCKLVPVQYREYEYGLLQGVYVAGKTRSQVESVFAGWKGGVANVFNITVQQNWTDIEASVEAICRGAFTYIKYPNSRFLLGYISCGYIVK